MKKYTLYFVSLLLLGVTVSCKKESSEKYILNARMSNFQTSKAYIDVNNYSCFRSGEEIRVNNQTCSVVPNSQDGNHTCGIANVTESPSGYYAFYPAGLLSGTPDISSSSKLANATVILPSVQNYVYENGHQVIDNPMAGRLSESYGTIPLHNLCALLKITVKATNTTRIDNIDVTLKGTTIWGTGTVDDTQWELVMDGTQQDPGDHSTVRLDFGQNGHQGNPNGETYYIVVPKTTVLADVSNSIQVKINGQYVDGTDLSKNYKTFNIALANNDNVLKNTIRLLPEVSIGRQFIIDNPKCVFTVEAAAPGRPARKVIIAQRNLYEHNTSHIWSCTGTPYHPIPTSTYNSYFTYNSNLTGTDDWGWQYTIDGNPPRTWRTPTMDEWKCILNGARNNTYNYQYKAVNNSWGLILYPDNFDGTYPAGNVSTTQWTALENAGCVFLAGRKSGNSPNDQGNALGHGYYAAANSYNGSRYCCLEFSPKSNDYSIFDYLIYDKNVANTGGVNVRLVHDLN